jgi:hypothetical protein
MPSKKHDRPLPFAPADWGAGTTAKEVMMYFYFDPAALQDRLEGAIAAVHAGGILPLIASSDRGARRLPKDSKTSTCLSLASPRSKTASTCSM